MAETSPQELFAETRCFCPVVSDAYGTMKLGLLSQILTSLGVTMTLAQLMESGKCFGCLGLTPAEQVELALLDLISANISGGGGGGIGAVMRGSGPPVADPADPTKGAIYYDDDPGSPSYETNWDWSVPGQFWIGA